MSKSKVVVDGKASFSSNGLNDDPVSFSDTKTKRMAAPDHLKTSNHEGKFDNFISDNSPSKSKFIDPRIVPHERVQPLPSMGGFRLQPRKNISSITSHAPSPYSSASSRGRKRGAPAAVSALVNRVSGYPRSFVPSHSGDHKSSSESKELLRHKNESTSVHSPTFVHHVMQSMSIRSPTPPTPSVLRESIVGNQETTSPFIVFSPSLKHCPFRQRPRSESFCSLDSSTKLSNSLATAPRIAPIYGSPRRKQNFNGNYGNNNDFSSTPRSQCHSANASQTPATPTSIRTLPSPHTTPLPRSIRLTPRSRRHREDANSIFLSPNEKLECASISNEGTSIFSFEGGVKVPKDAKERAVSKSSSYVPSPFTSSRVSLTSGAAFAGDCSRVETQSLLGACDSTSTLDYILSSNARAIASDFEGSLSDSSSEVFVLANPTTLAQERDAMTMPPPRPSRRRRMSPTHVSSRASNELNMKILVGNKTDAVDFGSSGETLTPDSVFQFQRNGMISSCAEKTEELSARSSDKPKPTKRKTDHKYVGRLKPIESCCSLVGLDLTEPSSSMADSNGEPSTPPSKLNASINVHSPRISSKSSVRISRCDAENIHLTIARMALLHQQSSPTISACSS